ncbi:glycosyltransferase [Gluconobacter kondonii]|uniref:glycosyltransferase family 2 protein n=1 Tax=Gluconobacter kondonii TaxID=941463 RepID=UPI001B8BD00C|nr:glycosyltransferase [Gluconobacter kondonii]
MNKNSCDVGIAIKTYLRKDMVCNLVDRIQALTRSDYKIVVCDDGSSDGTVEELRKKGITVLGGKNKSIARNKNRVLF